MFLDLHVQELEQIQYNYGNPWSLEHSPSCLQFLLLLLIANSPYKQATLTHRSGCINEAISCISDTTIVHLFA